MPQIYGDVAGWRAAIANLETVRKHVPVLQHSGSSLYGFRNCKCNGGCGLFYKTTQPGVAVLRKAPIRNACVIVTNNDSRLLPAESAPLAA